MPRHETLVLALADHVFGQSKKQTKTPIWVQKTQTNQPKQKSKQKSNQKQKKLLQ